VGRLTRDGVALAYEEAGSGAPPIVLVHDLGSDHTCFACQFEHFSHRHRTVAVDLRGHGQSGGPRGACAVDLLADDLAWLCYELGLYRPVLLGRGLGGKVALDLAARYPDLPSACVVVPDPSRATPPAPHHLVAAPRLETGSTWGHVAATAGSSVPVLHIASGAAETTSDWQRRDGLRLAPLDSAARQREDATVPDEINLLVDGFLLGLAGSAPP
jgi:pimeloyl-ACP methyl ester carboxylesterase